MLSKKITAWTLFSTLVVLLMFATQCGPVPTPERVVETVTVEGPPLPRLCDPDNPSPDSFRPAKDFERYGVPNPYLEGGPASIVLYENERGQRFDMTVSGKTEEAIAAYLGEVRLCFEASEVGEPGDEGGGDNSAVDTLIKTALESTGLSRAELGRAELDKLRPGKTLAEVITELGGDVDRVLNEAIARATEEIRAAVAEGTLTQKEADELLRSLESDFRQALEEEDIPSLFVFADALEKEGSEIGVILLGPDGPEGEDHLVIDMEWLDAKELDKPETFVVHFLIDPTVPGGQYNNYKSKCQRSAWARVRASAGKVQLYFWRFSPPSWAYTNIGYQTHQAGTPTPTPLSHTTPNGRNSTYDIDVYGYPQYSSSTYSVDGGWQLGSGGVTCPR